MSSFFALLLTQLFMSRPKKTLTYLCRFIGVEKKMGGFIVASPQSTNGLLKVRGMVLRMVCPNPAA